MVNLVFIARPRYLLYFIHSTPTAIQQIGYDLQMWFNNRLSLAKCFLFSFHRHALFEKSKEGVFFCGRVIYDWWGNFTVGTNICAVAIGVGRIFLTEGPLVDRGAKSGEISFSHSKVRKQPFLIIFSILRGPWPPLPPFPTPIAVAWKRLFW